MLSTEEPCKRPEAWVRNKRKATLVISVCQCTRRPGPRKPCWAFTAQYLLLTTLNTGLRRGAEEKQELGRCSGLQEYRQQGGRKGPAGGRQIKSPREQRLLCVQWGAVLPRLGASTTVLIAELLHLRAVKVWCCEPHRGPLHCSGRARKHTLCCF